MRQTIHRQALKAHFVPTATDSTNYVLGAARASSATERADARSIAPPVMRARKPGSLRQAAVRAAATVLWAVAGEKAFARALSRHDVPGAMIDGSLAAATAYAQERHARRRPLVSPHAAAKRSLVSFYAVMGMGLGVGAMFINRRRG